MPSPLPPSRSASRATSLLPAMMPLLAAALATPAAAEMPPGVSHFTLPNGLETVVIEDHRAPVVVQMVWYRIGSADESPGKSGIAHYLEHLMFKGTDTMKPGELSKTVTANGGMDNAFTSYDFTAYFQRIAADRLPLVMRMESDRMAHLRIGEDDWQAERQVVLAERAQRTDSDPSALFAEERSAVQFYNHPYGRPVIGWRQEMEGLTRDDALAWYGAHYAPNDAVLIVAGDVQPDAVRALAEQYYGPIPAKPDSTRKSRPQEPEQRADRRIEMRDPRVPQPVLSRSVLAPERNPGDQRQAAALTVLAEMLGGSAQTSALGQALMMTGKAIWVGASYDGLSVDPTTFAVTMVPAPGLSQADAEAALTAALDRFVQDGPDPAQLDRVRMQLKAQRIYDRDSAHGRAYDYGQGLAVGLSVEDVNDWPDLLAAVTPDDIRAAAALVLGKRAGVTSWLLPGQPETPATVAGDAPDGAAATADTVPGGGTANAADDATGAPTGDAPASGPSQAAATADPATAPADPAVEGPGPGTAAPQPSADGPATDLPGSGVAPAPGETAPTPAASTETAPTPPADKVTQ